MYTESQTAVLTHRPVLCKDDLHDISDLNNIRLVLENGTLAMLRDDQKQQLTFMQ